MARRTVRRPVVSPPLPPWHQLSTHAVFWHGCVSLDALDIQNNGIDLSRSRVALDFGRGFYVTTDRRRASKRAWRKHANLTPADRVTIRPAVVGFRVPLDRLAQLESLKFVRDNPAYWSFVRNCRQGTITAPRTHLFPGRITPNDYFDVVCGPIAAVWPPDGREILPHSDQFSFHTPAAVAILKQVVSAGPPDFIVEVL